MDDNLSGLYQDVDVGGDDALIVCTQSGHVFVAPETSKGSTTSNGTKAFKFHRVAHVHRAVAVCASSTGAFGVLRVDYKAPPINVTGRHFSAAMAAIAPYIDDTMVSAHQETKTPLHAIISTDDDLEDSSILDDIGEVAKLMTVLCNQVESSAEGNKVTVRTSPCMLVQHSRYPHAVSSSQHDPCLSVRYLVVLVVFPISPPRYI